MKTIGLIGGMSWESTAEYYQIINETVQERLGRLQSARIVMYSVDFEDVEQLQHEGKWDEAATLMIDAAKRVEGAGADFVLICTNTMHKMANEVAASINIPLLHIADATAERIVSSGSKKIALLGTKFTMEQDFYKDRLAKRNKLDVLIPDETSRQVIHDIIYKELCLGKTRNSSREQLKAILQNFIDDGAQGIILGCTELPLLMKQYDRTVPLFDTAKIHAHAAVEYALKYDGQVQYRQDISLHFPISS